MIKSFLNGVIGGFSRTLGRILFYIFIALIFYFIFGLKNVDAAELNVNAYTYSTMGNTFYQRMFTGYNSYGGSLSESNFSLGTTYSGRLKQIHFRVDRTFNYTNSYTLTLQANTSDFRNYLDSVFVDDTTNEVQCTTISSSFISKTKITVTFVCPYQVNSLTFHFYAKENNFLTGDTNFNIKNILLEENSNNQSNDDIINNDNQNTQDIINNNNSNTEDIIKSNQTCNYNLVDLANFQIGTISSDNGSDVAGNNRLRSITYIPIQTGVTYNFLVNSPYKYLRLFFYDKQKNYISSSGVSSTGSISVNNSNIVYVRLLYSKENNTSVNINEFYSSKPFFGSPDYCLSNTIIDSYINQKNSDNINNSLNDINSALTNQTPMDSSIFSDWWTNFTENYFSNPLGNLITLPINLVQKLINYSNTACSPVQLGSLLGHNLTLNCFTLGDYISNSVVLNVIDLIMSLSLIVFTLKKAYETVSNLLSLGGENEVKQHFKFPTPMEFIASLFGGGR